MKPYPINFKVLDYNYMNTGGNTMVGIFTVWLPEELRTVYALTNEEGCNLAVVDYISNELEVYDFDELIFDTCTYSFLKSDNKYFELYRYCLNEYTKSDCRYFGIHRGIPYELLSDKLQAMVDADYLVWLECNGYDVMTDGESILVHPDYDKQLQAIKNFKKRHDDLATDPDARELLYEQDYMLILGNEAIRIPFNADTYSAVEQLLKTVIETW